jgi:hypothetical protein
MPAFHPGQAVRLTLGLGPHGSSAVVDKRDPVPMARGVLAA